MRNGTMRAASMLVGLAIVLAPMIGRAGTETTGEKIERKAEEAKTKTKAVAYRSEERRVGKECRL